MCCNAAFSSETTIRAESICFRWRTHRERALLTLETEALAPQEIIIPDYRVCSHLFKDAVSSIGTLAPPCSTFVCIITCWSDGFLFRRPWWTTRCAPYPTSQTSGTSWCWWPGAVCRARPPRTALKPHLGHLRPRSSTRWFATSLSLRM